MALIVVIAMLLLPSIALAEVKPVGQLPSPRREVAGAAWVDGSVYWFGGFGAEGPLHDILRFDPGDGSLEQVAGTDDGVRVLAAATAEDAIYLMGGMSRSGFIGLIKRFDPATNALATMASRMPDDPSISGVVALGNGQVIYLFAGDSFWLFDPAADAITKLDARLPSARVGAAAALLDDSIYVFGGSGQAYSGCTFCNEVWRLSIGQQQVNQVATLPPGLAAPIAAVVDGNLFLLGGIDPLTGQPSPRMWWFDTRTNSFLELEEVLPTAAVWDGYATSASDIWLAGGAGPSGYSDELLQVTPPYSAQLRNLIAGGLLEDLPEQGSGGQRTATPKVVVPVWVWLLLPTIGLVFAMAGLLQGRARRMQLSAGHGPEVLHVVGLTVQRNGKAALQNASLSVGAGRLNLLVGPSGSGKSTLLQAIVGLIPFEGQVRLGGPRRPAGGSQVGYVPQETQLYERLSAIENVVYFGRQHGMTQAGAREEGRQLLGVLGLGDRADRPVGNLSGGEKRRVSAAAAMVHKPRLLVLDEPTSGLDFSARRELIDHLLLLAGTLGVGILASSHHLDDAERAHMVGVMARGRLLEWGRPQDLIARLPGEGRCIDIEFEKPHARAEEMAEKAASELVQRRLVAQARASPLRLRALADQPSQALSLVTALLAKAGFQIRVARLDLIGLNDVFEFHTANRGLEEE